MVWYTQINAEEDPGRVAFYANAAATAFLGPSGDQFFICGQKGVGKTLLLRHKSASLRRASSGVHFLPENELAETLQSNLAYLNDNELQRLSEWSVWQMLWRATLATVCAKGAGVEITPALSALFKDISSTSVLDHINAILTGNLLANIAGTIPDANKEIGSLLAKVKSGVFLFVDAIDELVLLHSGAPLFAHDAKGKRQHGRLSSEVWTAAQIGFAKAALDIHVNHRHIRVYGAFRYEAIEDYDGSDKQNIAPYILHVQYSDSDLKSMFKQKLSALEKLQPEIFSDTQPNIVTKFFSFSTFKHPTVRNADRTPLQEDVLDYMLRHTRGRPRELDDIGKGIQAIPVAERSAETVRERIRIRSGEFFKWAKAETIPYWHEECDLILDAVSSNWLSRDEKDALLLEYHWALNGIDPFLEMFRQGLLGCTVQAYGSPQLELKFRRFDPAAQVSIEDYKNADYFAFHPCVNIATHASRQRYRPDPWNVSGHRRPYIRAVDKGHVHIGAGALGLGCVVPILSSDTGLGVCVIQRPNERYQPLLHEEHQGEVTLFVRVVNEMPVGSAATEVNFTLLTEDTPEPDLVAAIEDWSRGERNLFALTDPSDGLAARLIAECYSLSTAVRGRNLSILAPVIGRHMSPGGRVYPFENDDRSVSRLRTILSGFQIEVLDVCADRICLPPRASPGQIEVSVESHHRVVIRDSTPISQKLFAPLASPERSFVQVVANVDDYEFMRLRKAVLVNGIHLFFGLASLRHLDQLAPNDPAARESMTRARASQLLVRSQDVQDILEVCGRLFSIGLLVEAEEKKIITDRAQFLILRGEVDAQLASVFDRLQTVPDEISRILNPTDENLLEKGRRFVQELRNLPERLKKSVIVREGHPRSELERVAREVSLLTDLFLDELLLGQSKH